jgi:hypothetical protein
MDNIAPIDHTKPSPFVPPPAVAEHIRRQPECQLLWAVLENGVEEYRKYATATSRRGKRLFREAEAWIMRDDPMWLFSFVSICHILEIDPDYLRTGLRRWREARTAPAVLQEAA